ncbi:MAG: hypothetical protein ACRDF6_09865 [bacterium]
MPGAARIVVTGLAVTVSLVTAGRALTAQDGQATIVIHVDNYAGTSGPDRSRAEAEMTRIYARAGVRAIWATGEDQAGAPGLHLRVQLLSSDMAMRKIAGEDLDDTVVGRSARDAGRAYIFTHRIAILALRQSDDSARLLGRVMAHEVGHLLLPVYSHSARGIMRADIDIRSKRGGDFTSEQAAAIRSMLLAASRQRDTR